MSTRDRAIKFGQESLALLEEKGECLETVRAIVEAANKIVNKLSDRTLKSCEYAGAVLDVKVTCTISIWLIYEDPTGWNNPEACLVAHWAEVKEILEELAGLKPIRTHERERERWTSHWQGLYLRGDDQMRSDVRKTARSRYKDFDMSLLKKEEE